MKKSYHELNFHYNSVVAGFSIVQSFRITCLSKSACVWTTNLNCLKRRLFGNRYAIEKKCQKMWMVWLRARCSVRKKVLCRVVLLNLLQVQIKLHCPEVIIKVFWRRGKACMDKVIKYAERP